MSRFFDLRTPRGALCAVLLWRLVLGLWALPLSDKFPETFLERRLALLPPQPLNMAWWERAVTAPWMRYDAFHYATLAKEGYNLESGVTAFHPLYPLLARFFIKFGLHGAPALLLVSTLCAWALTLCLARYAARFYAAKDEAEKDNAGALGNRAAWLLLSGPTGFLLLAPYNESLFLLLCVGCLWALRDEKWGRAALLGAAAALTRQQGIALALPLLCCGIAAFRQSRAAPRPQWAALFAWLGVPLGFGAFTVYRAVALHDSVWVSDAGPVVFIRKLLVSDSAQKMVPGQYPAPPWETISAQIRLIAATPGAYNLVIDLVVGGALVALALAGWRRYALAERLFVLVIVAVSLSYYNGAGQPLLSLPRHMMLAFPLYIALAQRSLQNPTRGRLTMELFLVLNFLLSAAYLRNGWVP